MQKYTSSVASLVILTMLLASSSLRAQTWNAITGGNWNDTTKWSTGVPPVEGSTTAVTFTPGTVAASFSATIDDTTAGGANSPFDLNTLTLNGASDNDSTLETVTINGTGHSLNFTGTAGTNVITYNVGNTATTLLKYTLNSVTTNTTLSITGTGGTGGSAPNTNMLRIVALGGTGSVSKTGTGRLELTGALTFTGGLSIDNGRLTLDTGTQTWSGGTAISGGTFIAGQNMSAGSGTITLSGGTLTYTNTTSGTTRSVANSLSFAGNMRFLDSSIQGGAILGLTGAADLGGTVRTIQTDATTGAISTQTAQMSGVISNGGIIKSGTGALRLANAANTYTGDTTVRLGTLVVAANAPDGANGALGNSTNPVQLGDGTSGTGVNDDINLMINTAGVTVGRQISVNNTGDTIAIGGTNTTGTVTYSNTITLNKAVTVTSGAGGTTVVSGQITDTPGTSAVVINGTQTGAGAGTGVVNFTATGGNSYGGGTTVQRGTFLVNNVTGSGTGSGNVTVQSTAILGGSGRIGGQVNLQNGSRLSPGNSPGVLTVNNNVVLETGSAVTLELIANTESGRGTNFDGVDITSGNLTIQSGVTADIVFNLAGSTVDFSNSFWANNRNWLIFDNVNAPSGMFGTVNLTADSTGALFGTGQTLGGTLGFSTVGNDVFLVYTAVPEPSTCLLIAAGLMFLVTRRKSRQFMA